MITEHIVVSPEVAEALQAGTPVVALESSVVTGGSFPANLETARAVEQTMRALGVVPARVALLDGLVRVGLDEEQLERLAQMQTAQKISTRDLAPALASRVDAGTTVSSSILAAAAVGIRFFCVAGIGGVHRGAEVSFDVSTDLEEIARTPIAVVCAGAKSLLDPALTLEYLETQGIPVVGYKSDELPNYLSVSSGQKVPWALEDPADVARFVRIQLSLPQTVGAVITHPIPAEQGLPAEEINRVVTEALDAAKSEGVTGQALTPVVLTAIKKATQGRSAAANHAVLVSTARAAAEIAVEYARAAQTTREPASTPQAVTA